MWRPEPQEAFEKMQVSTVYIERFWLTETVLQDIPVRKPAKISQLLQTGCITNI